MIAALGTLVFLATLWLLVVMGAAILEASGGLIVAALKGTAPQLPYSLSSARLRARPRVTQPVRAQAQWRDAA